MSSNYTIHRCEQCHQSFYTQNACRSMGGANAPMDGTPEGSYNARFCSRACANEWSQAHPGKSTHTAGERMFLGCLFAPVKVPWYLGKLAFKVIKPIIMNKWVWTIFSCGMAWAAWKLLDKIYNPKK